MKQTCSTRRRAPQTDRLSRPGMRYVLSLDAVAFHVSALRYRAGLTNNLNAEEQQLVRRAGALVADLMADDCGDAAWNEIWLGRHTEPAFSRRSRMELQCAGDRSRSGRLAGEEA